MENRHPVSEKDKENGSLFVFMCNLTVLKLARNQLTTNTKFEQSLLLILHGPLECFSCLPGNHTANQSGHVSITRKKSYKKIQDNEKKMLNRFEIIWLSAKKYRGKYETYKNICTYSKMSLRKHQPYNTTSTRLSRGRDFLSWAF